LIGHISLLSHAIAFSSKSKSRKENNKDWKIKIKENSKLKAKNNTLALLLKIRDFAVQTRETASNLPW